MYNIYRTIKETPAQTFKSDTEVCDW